MPTSLLLTPARIPRPQHSLSRKNLSPSALYVLYQLHRAGYQAYLVGGGVRDVLLQHTPKDFDVVTNARPEQIKDLFPRQCRLIGRRFVLAHVHCNDEIIEVSTFRSHFDEQGERIIKEGMIIRDNVYGQTVDEDASRRDFTVNALYYDISDFSLLDYANGLQDLQDKRIRLIGEPELRYQEDPVRMLRALRFAAKLNFSLDHSTADPIPHLSHLLAHIPPARLYEETLKLFLSGHAVSSFKLLQQYPLFKQLFPYTESCFEKTEDLQLIQQALENTDQRILAQKPVAPAFLLAVLLWPPLMSRIPEKLAKGIPPQETLLETGYQLLIQQNRHVSIPKRIYVLMQEIWLLQTRLIKLHKNKKALKLTQHPRFRAAYDFLLLRSTIDDSLQPTADWWKLYQDGDAETRTTLTKTTSRQQRRRSPKTDATPP